jgi:hypothetical protein
MDPLAAGMLAAGVAAAGLLYLFAKADCNLGLWWRSKPPAAAFKNKVVWITGDTCHTAPSHLAQEAVLVPSYSKQ